MILGNEVVFLSYLSRSGSTFLASHLSQLRYVHVTLEVDLPQRVVRGEPCRKVTSRRDLRVFVNRLYRSRKFQAWNVGRGDLLSFVEARIELPVSPLRVAVAIARYDASVKSPAARVVILKSGWPRPSDWLYRSEAFRGFRMLYLFRDPRAVYNSQRRARRPDCPLFLSPSPRSLVREWANQAKSIQKLAGSHSSFSLQYEFLVKNVESTMEVLSSWLNVPSELACGTREYGDRLPAWQQDLHERLSTAPDMSRMNRWKKELDPHAVKEIERLAGPVMVAQGYDQCEIAEGERIWRYYWLKRLLWLIRAIGYRYMGYVCRIRVLMRGGVTALRSEIALRRRGWR